MSLSFIIDVPVCVCKGFYLCGKKRVYIGMPCFHVSLALHNWPLISVGSFGTPKIHVQFSTVVHTTVFK